LERRLGVSEAFATGLPPDEMLFRSGYVHSTRIPAIALSTISAARSSVLPNRCA